MTAQIGLAGAFLGGLLVLLSPCAALLLPSFFAVTYDGVGTIAARTGLFFVGLVAVLAPIGAGVAAMGSLLTVHRVTVTTIGALILIVLGVIMIVGGGFGFGRLSGAANRVRVTGPLSTVALGAVYGFAGFCSGPLLGGVLTVGLVSGNPWYGALIMAVFAAGMTVPLLLLAVFWDRIGPRLHGLLRGREFQIGGRSFHTTSVVSGLALIAVGALLWFTEGTASLGGLFDVGTVGRWEATLAQWSVGVSDLEVVTAVLAVVVAILAIRVLRRRSA